MLLCNTPIIQEIKEPCYYDFLYEEIRENSESEILNTIIFECILRTPDIKEALNANISSEELLDNTINSPIDFNVDRNNPLNKRVNYFKEELSLFKDMIYNLRLKNDNSISEEELIQLFFNNDAQKYVTILSALNKIDKIIEEELLPNINLNIKYSSEKNKNNTSNENVNPYEIFNKYGLNYNSVYEYINELKCFEDEMEKHKVLLYNQEIDCIEYQESIKKIVKRYRRTPYNIILNSEKIIFLFGKRPISKVIRNIQINIPYCVFDSSKKRLKKTFEQINKIFDEKEIICEVIGYSKNIKKHFLKILSMKPDIFAQRLFVYDWIEYVNNDKNHTYYSASQKEKIEYLQSVYKELNKNTKYKTLENYLNLLRNFIQNLSTF